MTEKYFNVEEIANKFPTELLDNLLMAAPEMDFYGYGIDNNSFCLGVRGSKICLEAMGDPISAAFELRTSTRSSSVTRSLGSRWSRCQSLTGVPSISILSTSTSTAGSLWISTMVTYGSWSALTSPMTITRFSCFDTNPRGDS